MPPLPRPPRPSAGPAIGRGGRRAVADGALPRQPRLSWPGEDGEMSNEMVSG